MVADASTGTADARYRDAVRWMNRGCAFMERGDPASLDEALTCYARAISLLRTLPLAEHPSWANSLGAALMNQGQLLHRRHGLARARQALDLFGEAIAILAPLPADRAPWAHCNLAGTHLNRANLWLDLAEAVDADRAVFGVGQDASLAAAVADARSALAPVRGREHQDAIHAGLALKARRALCDCLGQLLAVTDGERQEAVAADAADVVDDALELIRAWRARGEAVASGELAVRLFRFGAELYRQHQPHFLPEFIEENLGIAPEHSDELHRIAHLALEAALAEGASPGIRVLGDPATERALRTRRELSAARARLAPAAFPA